MAFWLRKSPLLEKRSCINIMLLVNIVELKGIMILLFPQTGVNSTCISVTCLKILNQLMYAFATLFQNGFLILLIMASWYLLSVNASLSIL